MQLLENEKPGKTPEKVSKSSKKIKKKHKSKKNKGKKKKHKKEEESEVTEEESEEEPAPSQVVRPHKGKKTPRKESERQSSQGDILMFD